MNHSTMLNQFTLSESEVLEIEGLLHNTPTLYSNKELYANEFEEIFHSLPNLIPNSINDQGMTFDHYGPEECITVYYTSTNELLNEALRDIFNITKSARQFYTSEVTYLKGGKLKQHVDPHSDLTANILLGEEFTPGGLFINNKPIEFTKRGQAVSFPGKITHHRVEPIKAGIRRALSVWYKIPDSNLKPSLI